MLHSASESAAYGNTTAIGRDLSVTVFLQPFKQWIDDDTVTEIAVNRPGTVWIEKGSVWSSHPVVAVDSKLMRALGTAVAIYSGQKWDGSSPVLSASMPDGSRIQLLMPPAVEFDRISFTMRKPSRITRKLQNFSDEGLFKRVRAAKTTLDEMDAHLLFLLEKKLL